MKGPNEAFISGALPGRTYITRVMEPGFTYEERLKQALNARGFLILISGPSKTNKTVLCKKVIEVGHLVEISGSDLLKKTTLWSEIGMKAGMPKTGKHNQDNIEETSSLTKESVLAYFNEHDLVLLMDDFHYASAEMQAFMAQQFKDAIRKGFRIIITTMPYHVDDIIRSNPDLQGRISIIDMLE